MQYPDNILNYLKECHEKIVAFETEAKRNLEFNDIENYEKNMRAKAGVLAEIHDNARPLLEDFFGEGKFNLALALDRFASSARTALSLNSIFYMSALLYPDDHKAGMPDNLMLFIERLERGEENFF